MVRVCSVEGCANRSHSQGWCRSHHRRWRKYGDPNGSPCARKRTRAGEPWRFYQDVVLAHDADDCLIWPFGTDGSGYAQIQLAGKKRSISRLACEEFQGPPPTKYHQVAHSCGNGFSGCVARRHLRWATQSENEADKHAHGKLTRTYRGSVAKLTEAQVLEIRALLSEGVLQCDLVEKYGINRSSISSIATRKSWGWLADQAPIATVEDKRTLQKHRHLVSLSEACKITTCSRTMLLSRIKCDPDFPKPISIRAVGIRKAFVSDELQAWIDRAIAQRDADIGGAA